MNQLITSVMGLVMLHRPSTLLASIAETSRRFTVAGTWENLDGQQY